jgi:hypothetical protein
MDLVEVSFVPKPAQPEARIMEMPIPVPELIEALGDTFVPGDEVSYDRCLRECEGLTHQARSGQLVPATPESWGVGPAAGRLTAWFAQESSVIVSCGSTPVKERDVDPPAGRWDWPCGGRSYRPGSLPSSLTTSSPR